MMTMLMTLAEGKWVYEDNEDPTMKVGPENTQYHFLY